MQDPTNKRCVKCGDRLTGHEDDSDTHCRFCVTEARQPIYLRWKFDGDGEWAADSSEPDIHNTYRIQVCDDGTFDVSRSDGALQLDGMPCLQSLAAAKAACEVREGMIVRQRGPTCGGCGSSIDFDQVNAKRNGIYVCAACIENGELDRIAAIEEGQTPNVM